VNDGDEAVWLRPVDLMEQGGAGFLHLLHIATQLLLVSI
jgi:hypothetical protein